MLSMYCLDTVRYASGIILSLAFIEFSNPKKDFEKQSKTGIHVLVYVCLLLNTAKACLQNNQTNISLLHASSADSGRNFFNSLYVDKSYYQVFKIYSEPSFLK